MHWIPAPWEARRSDRGDVLVDDRSRDRAGPTQAPLADLDDHSLQRGAVRTPLCSLRYHASRSGIGVRGPHLAVESVYKWDRPARRCTAQLARE